MLTPGTAWCFISGIGHQIKGPYLKKVTMTQNVSGGLVLEQILWHDLTNGKHYYEIWE
jgi:hypothetical protein